MIPADRLLADDDENEPQDSVQPSVAPEEVELDPVADAVAAIGNGHAVVVVDDAKCHMFDREHFELLLEHDGNNFRWIPEGAATKC